MELDHRYKYKYMCIYIYELDCEVGIQVAEEVGLVHERNSSTILWKSRLKKIELVMMEVADGSKASLL